MTTNTIKKLEIKNDCLQLPYFRLEVNLSDKAVHTLQTHQKSSIVSFQLFGIPSSAETLPKH